MRLNDLPILVLLGTVAAFAQDAAPTPAAAPEPKPATATAPAPPTAVATAAAAAEPVQPESDAPIEIGRPVPATTNRAVLLKPATLAAGPGPMTGPGEARWIEFEHRRYGGLLGEAFATSGPWQFLNPFAPASYGDGTRYLRQDPYTGRAEGVILFSIRFPGNEGSKSLVASRARQAAKANPARLPASAPAPATTPMPPE